MPPVSGSRRQQLTVFFGACAVLAVGMLPAEHVHASLMGDGHTEEVVHRHFEPHHSAHAPITIDHPDDEVQWLTTSFTLTRSTTHVQRCAAVADFHLPTPPAALTSRAIGQVLFVSVHDPPWATPSGLRAPPISRL
jgi:hypothetical protein